MISTLMLTSLFAALAESPTPNLQRDYATAYKLAAEQKKPLAVFLGHGTEGLKTLVTDGGLSAEETKILNKDYVVLYVDTDSPAGKELAKTFELTEGLVISDRSGSKQAVRYDGAVAQSELNEMLTTYAQPTRTVNTTENRGRFRGVIRNVMSAPVQLFNGYGNGGCATGNCPNRR